MVKSGEFTVTLSLSSRKSIKQISDHLSLESTKAAEKIVPEIIESIEQLKNNPSRYPLDRFHKNNDPNFSAFEKHYYRIPYRFKENQIWILNIRHVKQEPLDY